MYLCSTCVLECEWPWPSNILLYSLTNTRALTLHICNVPNAFIHFKEHSQYFIVVVVCSFVCSFIQLEYSVQMLFMSFSAFSSHAIVRRSTFFSRQSRTKQPENRVQSMICFRYDLQSVSSIFALRFWCAATIDDCCWLYLRLYFANNMRRVYAHINRKQSFVIAHVAQLHTLRFGKTIAILSSRIIRYDCQVWTLSAHSELLFALILAFYFDRLCDSKPTQVA